MAAAFDAASDLASNGRGGGAVGVENRVGESMDSAREGAHTRCVALSEARRVVGCCA